MIVVDSFKPVAESKNNLASDGHVFVDLERVVYEMLEIIYGQINKFTSDAYRVPPLVLMRFARGGKTSSLSKAFDKIKAEGRVNPILISFNGHGKSAFQHRTGETQSQAILRLIAAQLGDYTPEQTRQLIVDRDALDAHLGDNFVLLIDELNMLTPIESDAARLLREMFLDKKGRFLVFTSHYPYSIEPSYMASDVLGQAREIASNRGISTVDMSLASSTSALQDLRAMSKACEALTEERAAWLGYIPSLIYTTMNDKGISGVMTPRDRFVWSSATTVEPLKKLDVLQRFVFQLLTGEQDAVVAQHFKSFASIGENKLISYPLCYVKEIFAKLNVNVAVTKLLKVLEKLESHLDVKYTGMAWECTVQIAIILRILAGHWSGLTLIGPFNLIEEGKFPQIDFRTLPDECKTLQDANQRMDAMISEYKEPTLIYVDSANAKYPDVEGFVVYTTGEAATTKKVGFLMKTSDRKPCGDIDKTIINGGAVLIRGKVKAKNLEIPKAGWQYMTTDEVRNFLGNSLLLAMPRDML